MQALRATESELSAQECADAVGISRVSARRYLEYLPGRGPWSSACGTESSAALNAATASPSPGRHRRARSGDCGSG